ncbi:MAG: flagellar hook assembly protein FlgD [Pseudomonadota bacterium]|jgi:flagellar basal-body rod modification protein FlgD|nr:MAG: flagellar hook capping protein [Pseudomonadota bacterium]
MGIDAISSSTSAAASQARARDQLGQDQFLTLMLAQLRHQDPTSPLDPAEFLGQLAQFSTVTGIQGMQGSIAALSEALRSSQVLNGTHLVGRDVLVDGDTGYIAEEGGSIIGMVDIPQGTRSVNLVITDASGQQVRRIALAPAPGEIVFEWDGTLEDGERAPAGDYTIEVVADVAGTNEQLPTQLLAHVGSVSIDPKSSTLTLNTDLGPVALGDVRQVM